MPRGQPDFGMYAAQTYVGSLADMGELAVRLGSISIFDRRGKVIDLDDFEGPLLKWHIANDGDAYTRFTSSSAKSGAQSVWMHVGGAADTYTWMARGYSLRGSKRIGVELSYALPGVLAYLRISLNYTDDVRTYYARLKLDFSTLKLSYLDSDNIFQEIDDIPSLSGWAYMFYPVKLVADFETGKYVRALLRGKEYDLSTYDLYSPALEPTQAMAAYVRLERVAGVGSSVYIDDYILTMDEP